MKSKMLILLILLFLFSSTEADKYTYASLSTGNSVLKFNSKNVYDTISELSGSKYKGRLAGENGNILAEKYISDYFKKTGLKPLFKFNSFFQKFSIFVPVYKGDFSFQVFDRNGKEVRSYQYGKDFKEITYGNISPGNLTGRLATHIGYGGDVLLVSEGEFNESLYSYKEDLILKEEGLSCLVYKTATSLRFKSPYKLQVKNSDGLLKFLTTSEVFKELVSFSKEHYTVRVKSNACIKKATVCNVAGFLEGTDKTLPPVILSCHLDHVGSDQDGTVYPGALDNASGTGFLMECARILKSYSRRPNVIFVVFNAEEEGLLGSDYFVHHAPVDIKKAACINFDMVGSARNIPLAIMTSNSNKAFAEKLLSIFKSASHNVTIGYGDNSDHASFNKIGVAAVTLINDDETKIHTPYDDIRNISQYKFGEIFNILNTYLTTCGIEASAFKKEGSLKANNDKSCLSSNAYTWLLIFFLIISFLLAGVYLAHKRVGMFKVNKHKIKFKK